MAIRHLGNCHPDRPEALCQGLVSGPCVSGNPPGYWHKGDTRTRFNPRGDAMPRTVLVRKTTTTRRRWASPDGKTRTAWAFSLTVETEEGTRRVRRSGFATEADAKKAARLTARKLATEGTPEPANAGPRTLHAVLDRYLAEGAGHLNRNGEESERFAVQPGGFGSRPPSRATRRPILPQAMLEWRALLGKGLRGAWGDRPCQAVRRAAGARPRNQCTTHPVASVEDGPKTRILSASRSFSSMTPSLLMSSTSRMSGRSMVKPPARKFCMMLMSVWLT